MKTNQLYWIFLVYSVVNIIDSHVTFRQHNWTKNGFKSFFCAKTKRMIIHLESIIMDFIISRKSHYNGFFSFFCLPRREKLCKNFGAFIKYPVSYAEVL